MKKTTLVILFIAMVFSGFAQEDWFGFNRYRADNERIVASGEFPEVVFMGNSITEYWALYHPEFFKEHNFCGRGIGEQTSTQMLARFTADVGCTIGYHKHETNSEVILITSGTARCLYDDGEERLTPGDCHYCPRGHSHSLINASSTEPLEYFAIVPEHN